MNTTKIIIGSTVLIGAAGIAYMMMKRSQAQAGGSTASSSPGSSLLPSTVTTPPASSSKGSNYPEGALLRAGSSSEVYIIDAQGYRHWITSRSAFDRMSLSMTNVKSITAAEMESIPRAENIAGLGVLL